MTMFARDAQGASIQAIYPGATDQVDLTTGSAQSAPVGQGVTAVRVWADVDCFIAIGNDPTAVAGASVPIKAGAPEYFAIRPGEKVAGVVAAGSGNLYVTQGANF